MKVDKNIKIASIVLSTQTSVTVSRILALRCDQTSCLGGTGALCSLSLGHWGTTCIIER